MKYLMLKNGFLYKYSKNNNILKHY